MDLIWLSVLYERQPLHAAAPRRNPWIVLSASSAFLSSERAASNAQPMNSVHMCVFSIFSTGGGQQVFSVSKELKMYLILLSPILVPFSFSHFCYQIWVLGYWSIVFGQVPLISALSSIPRRVARLQQHSRELFLCCWQKRQVETLNSWVPISTVWLGSCASWVMSPVHSILLPALRPSSYRCFGRNSFNRQTQ